MAESEVTPSADFAESTAPTTPTEPSEPPRRSGCLLWGCLTVFLFLLVVGGYVGLEIYEGYQVFKKFVSDKPSDLPVRQLKEGELEGVTSRLQAFGGAPPGSRLDLSADDLNVLLAGTPSLQNAGGKAHASIDGDLILVDVSVPTGVLKKVGEGVTGKYFNGTFGLKPGVEKGQLVLFPQGVTTSSGEKVPDGWFISLFKTHDLLSDIRDKAGAPELRSHVEKVEVANGKLTIVK